MEFHQSYGPVAGSVPSSALVASLPLARARAAAGRAARRALGAAVAAASTAFLLAWLVWGMPLALAIAAATHGMAFGLWPISWVVVSAVFFYNLTVESGDFDVIRRSLARLTADRRIQAPARRVLLRRARRGDRRLRRAGRDHRVDAGGPRLRAGHGRVARARREHRAGGVRLDRHPGHDARRPARADARPRRRRRRRARCRRWSAASCRSSRWSIPAYLVVLLRRLAADGRGAAGGPRRRRARSRSASSSSRTSSAPN